MVARICVHQRRTLSRSDLRLELSWPHEVGVSPVIGAEGCRALVSSPMPLCRYQRSFSFAGFQANQPNSPLPGQRVDIELDDIAANLAHAGASAYQLAIANGFVGSESDYLASLKSTVPGPAGPAGTPGTPGQTTVDGLTDAGAAGKLIVKSATPTIAAAVIVGDAAAADSLSDAPFTALGAPYAIGSRDRARMLHRSVMEWIPKSLWAQCENGSALTAPGSATRVDSYIQAALNTGYHIRVPGGQYPVKRGVNLTREGQCFEGFSRLDSRLVALPGFETGSSYPLGVIQSVPYAAIGRIGVFCTQPASPATFADFNTYPAAFFNVAQRSVLENVPYFQATIGIDMRGFGTRDASGAVPNNASGAIVTNVRGSALVTDIAVADVYDFTQITDVHCYWDDYESNAAYSAILLFRDVFALDIGYCKSLKVGDVSMWQRNIRNTAPIQTAYGKTYNFTTTFGILKFDGYSSGFQNVDGRVSIDTFDWLCDKGVPYTILQNVAGSMVVANVHGMSTNSQSAPLVQCLSGSLKLGAGFIQARADQLVGEVTGGELDMGNVDFPFGSNVARTAPYLRASGGGRMRVAGAPQDKGAGSGMFFQALNSAPHKITSDCRGWAISAPDTAGDYSGASNAVSTL